MKNRTISIDANLLANPSQCDEKVRVFKESYTLEPSKTKVSRPIGKFAKNHKEASVIQTV